MLKREQKQPPVLRITGHQLGHDAIDLAAGAYGVDRARIERMIEAGDLAIDDERPEPPAQRPRRADRPRCGAKTRTGAPCRAPGNGRGNRCKLHGGKSTGPRTPEGVERRAAALKERWRKWRLARGLPADGDAF